MSEALLNKCNKWPVPQASISERSRYYVPPSVTKIEKTPANNKECYETLKNPD
jgi:hypothetical protein